MGLTSALQEKGLHSHVYTRSVLPPVLQPPGMCKIIVTASGDVFSFSLGEMSRKEPCV